ncbi:MAG: restriction endonuclease subunit S [Rhizobiales bacterium]|nr:restriction endonuclease subunit S [Hyphomicrobiales bacterium]
MASDQPNSVLVIRGPSETKAHKLFLGYDWSSAKGDEGIKLIKDAHGHHLTLLYDETNRDNAAKLNRLIADNFDGRLTEIPEALSGYASRARLVDMLDFGRAGFEKVIALTPKSSLLFKSNSPLVRLGDVATFEKGVTYSKADQVQEESDNVILTADNITLDGCFEITKQIYLRSDLAIPKSKMLVADDVFICVSSGSKSHVGKVALFDRDTRCYAGGFMGIIRAKNGLLPKVLFEILNWPEISKVIRSESSGTNIQNLSSSIAEIKIPLPPLEIQHQIVTECEAVDTEAIAARERIAAALADMESRVDAIYASAAPRQAIDQLALAVQYGLSEKMNEAGIGYKIFRMNEIALGRMVDNGAMKCADISAEEFAKYKLNRGDVLFNRTNSIEHVGKTGLFDLDGEYCFASYLVRVVPDTGKVLPLFLTRMMNSKAFLQEARNDAARAINQANINATKMRQIKVPLPSLADQKRFVSEIEALERGHRRRPSHPRRRPARKQAIMQRYL